MYHTFNNLSNQYQSFTILEGLIAILYTSISITYIINILLNILHGYSAIQTTANLLFTQKNFINCCLSNINNYNYTNLCLNLINQHQRNNQCTIKAIFLSSPNDLPNIHIHHPTTYQFKLTCYSQEKIINLIP